MPEATQAQTSAKDLFAVVKKSPSLMITLGVVGIAVVYYMYQKSKASMAASAATMSSPPSAFAPAMGTYTFVEDIHQTLGPTPITIVLPPPAPMPGAPPPPAPITPPTPPIRPIPPIPNPPPKPIFCLDLLTEIMTLEGWKFCQDLRIGDTTIGLDATGQFITTQVTHIAIHENACQGWELIGDGLHAYATPEHRWFVRDSRGEYVWRQTEEIAASDEIQLANGKRTTVTQRTPMVLHGSWCPTTLCGTWLARRDDCTYFTGNKPR